MKFTDKEAKFIIVEYISNLNTLDLAVAFHPDEPNRAIKKCLGAITPRIEHPVVRKIFTELKKKPFPVGALKSIRRSIENAAGGQVELESES